MKFKVGDLITYANIYQVVGIGESSSRRDDDPHPVIEVRQIIDHPRRRQIDLTEEGNWIKKLRRPSKERR